LGAASLLAAASSAQAQVIYTENFNGGTPSNGSYPTGSNMVGTSVTPTTGNAYIINKAAGDNFMALTAGQYQTVLHQSSAKATPMFNLFAGFSYTVTFDQSVGNLGSGPAAGDWQMFVNLGFGTATFLGTGPANWTTRSFTYTPTENVANAVMNFIYSDATTATPGSLGYNAAFLDNISITAQQVSTPPTTTVPEPSTVVLMTAGLAGLGVFAKRRARA
jgi:hypothetical protein